MGVCQRVERLPGHLIHFFCHHRLTLTSHLKAICTHHNHTWKTLFFSGDTVIIAHRREAVQPFGDDAQASGPGTLPLSLSFASILLSVWLWAVTEPLLCVLVHKNWGDRSGCLRVSCKPNELCAQSTQHM